MGLEISFSAEMDTQGIIDAIEVAALKEIDVPKGKRMLIELVQVRRPTAGFAAKITFEAAEVEVETSTSVGDALDAAIAGAGTTTTTTTDTDDDDDEHGDVDLDPETPETAITTEDDSPNDDDPVFA